MALYAVESITVTITTGGFPDGTCASYGEEEEELELNNSQYTATMVNSTKAAVLRRLLRIREFDDRGRNGGGFELFRGGYAKCILPGCHQRTISGV